MLIPRPVFSLSKLCNGEASRYALGSVLFERIDDDWCRAVVTDARCLVVVEWKENHAFDGGFGNFPLKSVPGYHVLIPAVSCEALRRFGKPSLKAKVPPKCEVVAMEEQSQDGHYEFQACVLTDAGRQRYSAVAGEGRFPRWQGVAVGRREARTGDPLPLLSMDTALFARVLGVVDEASQSEEGAACVVSIPPNADEPVIITTPYNESPRVFAMVMQKVRVEKGEAVPSSDSELWWPTPLSESPASQKPDAPPATAVGTWREVVLSASEAMCQNDTLGDAL